MRYTTPPDRMPKNHSIVENIEREIMTGERSLKEVLIENFPDCVGIDAAESDIFKAALMRYVKHWQSVNNGNHCVAEQRKHTFTEYEQSVVNRALRILENKLTYHDEPTVITEPSIAERYCQLWIGNEPSEVLGIIWLDTRHRMIKAEIVFQGTIDGASIYPRELIRRALVHNAAAVIMTHNHPSGVADPSQADINITRRCKEALSLLDIRLLDHVIVSPVEVTSMANRGFI